MRHGESTNPFPIEVWLGDDKELALANADMDEWLDAHPCNCEALCVCDAALLGETPE